MEDRSLTRVGGMCAILLGISYILVGITFMFDTVRTAPTRHEFLMRFAQNPPARLLNHAFFLIGAILALGAIPAISQIVRKDNEGWVRWATNVAYLGIVVTALTHIEFLTLTPLNARLYASGDEFARTVFLASPRQGTDISGWLRYGCLGIWMLIIVVLAWRHAALPRLLVYLGILGAVLYILIPVSSLLPDQLHVTVETVAAGLGGIVLAPIWFLWIGALLYRSQRARAREMLHDSELTV